MRHRIGIDFGGTKIEGIVMAPDGRVVAQRRIETPAGSYKSSLAAVATLVGMLEADAGILHQESPVGVGMPGTISPATGLVKNANSTWLNGQPFDLDLTHRLGRPVRFANDANCFAVSEATDGAAAGLRCVFGVILGTGVGGGIAIDGRALAGHDAIAGEWGHNPLPRMRDDERPGPACYCGRRGCIEAFLSGPGFAADHEAATGERIDARQIVARAANGNEAAAASLARYIDRLGRALAGVVNILDPDAIVLGGGLSDIDALYEYLPAAVVPHVFSDRFTTPILKPEHGAASGVRGAALLWPPEEPQS